MQDRRQESPEAAAPQIYLPSEVANATSPQGRRQVFFRIPELDVMLKQVIASQPNQFTYRWAYHPGQKVHVLLFGWPSGHSAGVAIPEGVGDAVLNYMLGTTDVFITSEPITERLAGDPEPEQVLKVINGITVGLTDVKFKPDY